MHREKITGSLIKVGIADNSQSRNTSIIKLHSNRYETDIWHFMKNIAVAKVVDSNSRNKTTAIPGN